MLQYFRGAELKGAERAEGNGVMGSTTWTMMGALTSLAYWALLEVVSARLCSSHPTDLTNFPRAGPECGFQSVRLPDLRPPPCPWSSPSSWSPVPRRWTHIPSMTGCSIGSSSQEFSPTLGWVPNASNTKTLLTMDSLNTLSCSISRCTDRCKGPMAGCWCPPALLSWQYWSLRGT